MNVTPLLQQSSRIALAAFLHDLGKFAERARIEAEPQTLDDNKQLYCPHRKKHTDDKGWFSHVHAAYTGLAMDLIEDSLPDLTGADFAPFGSWKTRAADDSFINAAAKHHKPDSFLQWIVATADRLASGFDREEFEKYNEADEGTATGKNHYTARQLTLFEQINKTGLAAAAFKYRYPLKPLSPDSLFPVEAKDYEGDDKEKAQQEYAKLWHDFTLALTQIPTSHRHNWPLWLDHFETVWGVYTQAIPSATAFNVRPDVSLYDHSRVTAALATALWRYHHENHDTGDAARKALSDPAQSWGEAKFLLVQGDFFGIQDFIFASGGDSNKRAAKLLRGRSFYVSLLAECAALKVLDALDLPATSQVINAAGKFMIVASNTDATIEKLRQVQHDLDDWFLRHSYGQAGVGLAWTEASGNDFCRKPVVGESKSPYRQLLDRLFDQLEIKKYQRFGLCARPAATAVFSDFLDGFDNEKGVCKIDGRSPARHPLEADTFVGDLARDQIEIGHWLTRRQRILITRQSLNMPSTLKTPVFGYHISFVEHEEGHGKFGEQARNGNLLRAWDFALPQTADAALWNGYARRNINAYVPIATETDKLEEQWGKYIGIDEKLEIGTAKTLNHLACANRRQDDSGDWIGISALSTLKGDVDNLGNLFQSGLGDDASFSKTAALSRQLNNFFAVYLPWLCQKDYPDTYTVFAGGDDFFLIGPWLSQIQLAEKLRQAFQRYVAHNTDIHFSVGISSTKPGLPIHQIGELAEQALEQAKAHNPEKHQKPPKNAVTCFGQTVFWDEFAALTGPRYQGLQRLSEDHSLSTGYVYGLLHLIAMAEKVNERPENALWHSYFAYRTARMLERNRKLDKEQRKRRQAELADEIANAGIIRHGGNYRIALFCHLYQQRD
ncbi:MAG: type III-A CRISPR-associated protein Cas10/Csm1 [Methylomonas sp.]|nr:type III-A CRISPR-associated protein Cas10/Csm1 [Methylomonas sp.]PPD21134.1 MAG: type III-A CRISPR-associated protein Cas10/Csm1 [Methylomonas sp.]PPD27568.1 MAG: type III-A CRISPR-associated protein Cas10/Csm1 [Methylomonas sp.]PPD39564.1 MAG: type III-A CRISPR-associated protein Cas10/Csm1 [Methylomonas sp.]PPD55815.1 MAG: type III-A CRISPR-associated protein Cas10/Csm1 [Methylomonas sp.]